MIVSCPAFSLKSLPRGHGPPYARLLRHPGIKYPHGLPVVFVAFDERQVVGGDLIAVMAGDAVKDDMEAHLEIGVIDGPVVFLGQRPGGKEDHAGMIFQVENALPDQGLLPGGGVVVKREIDIVCQQRPGVYRAGLRR